MPCHAQLRQRPKLTFPFSSDVFHGYSDYLQINVNAALYNPSNITIGVSETLCLPERKLNFGLRRPATSRSASRSKAKLSAQQTSPRSFWRRETTKFPLLFTTSLREVPPKRPVR